MIDLRFDKSMKPSGALCLLSLLALLGASSGSVIRAASDCTIKVNGGLPDPQPLILKVGGSYDGFGFHLPSSAGVVTLAANTVVRLVCAGASNSFTALGTSVRDVQAICIGGSKFSVSGKEYSFTSLKCKSLPVHLARPSGAACYNGNSILDIGFEVGTELVQTLEICFDNTNLNALWSKYDLVKNIGGYQSGFPRPSSFSASTFYPGLNPDTQYTRNAQRATVATLLGSSALADQYIHPTNDYFMSRGHLAANADFVYGSEMATTFYFVNVAPQWQTFNGGNWNTLESNTRDYASNKGLDLKVYTGTYGTTTLPNVNKQKTKIYLYKDKNNNYQIPVPAVYWKVVYDPIARRGVALIGVNNPYIDFADLGAEEKFCTNVCSQITWLKWAPTDQKNGFGFCCDVNEFRKTVPYLPNFTVTGLLV